MVIFSEPEFSFKDVRARDRLGIGSNWKLAEFAS